VSAGEPEPAALWKVESHLAGRRYLQPGDTHPDQPERLPGWPVFMEYGQGYLKQFARLDDSNGQRLLPSESSEVGQPKLDEDSVRGYFILGHRLGDADRDLSQCLL